MDIAVVGLGKLGLCLAIMFASKEYKVKGIDTSNTIVNSLNYGIVHIKEPKIKELFKKHRHNMEFSTHCNKLGDIVFIVVPTPSLESGVFDDIYIRKALDRIESGKTVVIVSTVSPGTMDRLIKDYSKLTLIYNPEFIALGSVIRDLSNPDFVLIGANQRCEKLEEIYKRLCKNPKFAFMKPLEAEITKLALNCYITTKITFANQLGNICEGLKVNVHRITEVLGMDSRIGKKYLRSGLGFGGPCFPRDNQAFMAFAKSLNKESKLAKIVVDINDMQVDFMVDKIIAMNPKTVGFESLSYKDGCDIIEKSQLKDIYDRLKALGYEVRMGKGDVTLNHWGIV